MVNVTPMKYRTPITIRVDDEFVDAVKELRRAVDDPPSKSEVIRSAVLAARDRQRKQGKRNGR